MVNERLHFARANTVPRSVVSRHMAHVPRPPLTAAMSAQKLVPLRVSLVTAGISVANAVGTRVGVYLPFLSQNFTLFSGSLKDL